MSAKCSNNTKLSFIYFGDNDWWNHNRADMDMQLVRRFAKRGPTVFVNSIVMQKLNLGDRQDFITRLARKTKSIFTGLKKTVRPFAYDPIMRELIEV